MCWLQTAQNLPLKKLIKMFKKKKKHLLKAEVLTLVHKTLMGGAAAKPTTAFTVLLFWPF